MEIMRKDFERYGLAEKYYELIREERK